MNRINSEWKAKLCPGISGVIPSSSIRDRLGPSLAQVFFQYVHDDTKKLISILAPLKTSKCFSDSSEDDARNVTFTVPSNNQVIKALVHQNILEVGGDILQRVEKGIAEQQRKIVEKQARQKFFLYQAKKRREVEEYALRIHTKYDNYLKDLQKELQKQIEIEWAAATAEHMKNLQKAVVQERIDVVREMMLKMREEISHVVQILYKDFEDSFRAQKEQIIADFNQIMREKHVQLHNEIRELKKKLNRQLYIQRHQYEMQNTVDIIYVLCLERLRNEREKHAIHEYFEKQINEFFELIVRLKDVLTIMRDELIRCYTEKQLLEEQMCQITKHFQKFIDFVFCTEAGQAEYLPSFKMQQMNTICEHTNEKEQWF